MNIVADQCSCARIYVCVCVSAGYREILTEVLHRYISLQTETNDVRVCARCCSIGQTADTSTVLS